MEKFFKSIFQPDKKKGSNEEEGEEEKGDNPPMDGRRQLSISRSGRMRQANKKRHSLTLELYGDIDIDAVEKTKSVAYHVNKTAPATFNDSHNRLENDSGIITKETTNENTFEVCLEKNLTSSDILRGARSPEEEIDNAFEIIDNT